MSRVNYGSIPTLVMRVVTASKRVCCCFHMIVGSSSGILFASNLYFSLTLLAKTLGDQLHKIVTFVFDTIRM